MSLVRYSSVENPNTKTVLFVAQDMAKVVFGSNVHIDYLIIPASTEIGISSLTNSRLKSGNRLYVKAAKNANFPADTSYFIGYLEYDHFFEGPIDDILGKVESGKKYIINGAPNSSCGVNRAPTYICLHTSSIIPFAQKLPLSLASKIAPKISNEAFPAGSPEHVLLSKWEEAFGKKARPSMSDKDRKQLADKILNGENTSPYAFVYLPIAPLFNCGHPQTTTTITKCCGPVRRRRCQFQHDKHDLF